MISLSKLLLEINSQQQQGFKIFSVKGNKLMSMDTGLDITYEFNRWYTAKEGKPFWLFATEQAAKDYVDAFTYTGAMKILPVIYIEASAPNFKSKGGAVTSWPKGTVFAKKFMIEH